MIRTDVAINEIVRIIIIIIIFSRCSVILGSVKNDLRRVNAISLSKLAIIMLQ